MRHAPQVIMKSSHIAEPLVLAIYLNKRGFGFAVFEGVAAPVDWGRKTRRREQEVSCLEKARILIDRYKPSVIVLRDCADVLSDKPTCAQTLTRGIIELAEDRNITLNFFSRADIDACFKPYGANNKDDVARVIAKMLPEFEQSLPPKRRTWQGEANGMGLFDALALVFTCYASEHVRTIRKR